MDIELLRQIILLVPEGATEVIVKGRETREVFFCMPKDWRPDEEFKPFIARAPAGPYYKEGLQRWRCSVPEPTEEQVA